MNSKKIIICCAVLLASLFVYAYVANEAPVYIWDWGVYFEMYKKFGHLLIHDRPDFARWAIHGIRIDDYNPSSVILLFPFFALFGDSRTFYILGIALFYLLPTAWLATRLVLNAANGDEKRDQNDILTFGLIFVSALFFHQFWAPTLRGMPDIAGLVPLGAATLLVTRADFFRRVPLKPAVTVGLLLWLAFLFRRWYAFAAVGLMVASALMTFALALRSPRPLASLVRASASYAAMAAVILLCVVLFQFGLLQRILTTSYADAYAGYQQPFLVQVDELFSRGGPVLLLLLAVGLLIGAVRKNAIVLFSALAAVVTFVTFSMTQAASIQHTLPVFFWIFIIAYTPIALGLNALRGFARAACAVVAAAYGVLALASVFAPKAHYELQSVAFALPRQTLFPLQVDNFEEYQRLIRTLHALPIGDHDLAVFASGVSLSDSFLIAADGGLRPSINEASQVDSRDHMRISTLRSNYAIVSNPVATHLHEGAQRVVTIPAQSIIDRTQFGAGYEKIAGPFALADGLSANIYKRTRALNNDDIAWVQKELNKTYPGWKANASDMIE